jgi:hypothetical protein
VSQHSGLTPDRWRDFTLDQQVLMVANELNRCARQMGVGDAARRSSSYERVLALTDLTIAVHERRSLRRELLRWRDLVAELYVREQADPVAHRNAMRCLLRFTPEASRQIPLLEATRAR